MVTRATLQCPASFTRSHSVPSRSLVTKQGYARAPRNIADSGKVQRLAAAHTTHAQPTASRIKPLKEHITPRLEWNKELKKCAESLIFGSLSYPDFSPKEKKIVDFYQGKISEVDGGLVLPNTHAELEQQEVEKILKQTPVSKKR